MAEPIDPKYHDQMNELAHFLDLMFNPQLAEKVLPGLPQPVRRTGFFLAVFETTPEGEVPEPGRFNYISNADRLDVKVLLREMTARFEGQPYVEGSA